MLCDACKKELDHLPRRHSDLVSWAPKHRLMVGRAALRAWGDPAIVYVTRAKNAILVSPYPFAAHVLQTTSSVSSDRVVIGRALREGFESEPRMLRQFVDGVVVFKEWG